MQQSAHEPRPAPSERGASLKILWIAGSRIVGGAERVTLQIAGLLAARGHRMSALYPFGSALESALRANGIPAAAARIGGALNVRAIGAITRAIAAQLPDIALVTTSDEWVWASLARRDPAQTRLILVRHMALPLPAKVRWLANRRADAIIAVSETVRASLSPDRFGIAPARLHTIPNPVRIAIREEPPARAARLQARSTLGLAGGARLVGFFGGAEPRKGIADILQAIARIRSEGLDCHLMLCGRGLAGDATPRIEGLIAQHGIRDAVHRLGEVSDIATAILACDAVAMPTHANLSEGMPLIVLEAIASGTPVAAYDIGGAREALADDAGLLARPDDPVDLARQLARLLTEPDLADTVAARGLARAHERYTPELAADRYEGVMRAVRASR